LYCPAPLAAETLILPAVLRPDVSLAEPTINVPAVIFAIAPDVTFKLPPVVLDAPTFTGCVPFGNNDTVPVPAFTVPAILTSPVVIDIAVLPLVLRLFPDNTVTTPVPFADSVTPLAPDELALNVIPPLLALVASDSAPVAVIAPDTVIA
jgi:hypothetical protein